MALILCLETATTNCSLALALNGEVIALEETNDKQFAHAEKLHVFIENVLKKAGLSAADLDAVAVSKGPGSYTGLRIGVSAAKGLCFALNIPLLSVSTLESMVAQVNPTSGFIVPMLDARRMEVYSAVFSFDKKQLRETKAEILTEHSFSAFSENENLLVIGSGAAKFKAICKNGNIEFMPELVPSAREMAALANSKHKISDTEDVAYFEPFYLKDFVAG